MREYELRILNLNNTLALSMLTMQLNAAMAIRAAHKMAEGRPFEVWCDDSRIHSNENKRASAPRPAA
jgi:hypothetical protein